MTELRLYNTLTRQKDVFAPIDPKNVRMYVCGPTVYDFAHIGNARPVIVFDVLFRLLRHVYGETHVTYVRNITDVDDKINARAAEEGVSIRNVTERTARQYHDDVAALGCLPPTHEPRATEYIAQMVAMIEKLIAAGHAYPAEGHVLFDVSSKADYGKLSRRSLDEMIAGARVEIAPYKKNPMDFVLWKPSDKNTPGWDSPWGRGRPGWHIECSAMSESLLGETFDIHGGGIDLTFPHHENEIAQSEGAHHNHPFAKVWMHNGFLQVEGEKMSKSLGNFFTIRDLLADWPGEVLRFNMLRTHYRQPMDWTLAGMKESWNTLERWYGAVKGVETAVAGKDVLAALADDLNTPQAIAELHKATPDELAGGLTLLGFSVEEKNIAAKVPVDAGEIERAIEARLGRAQGERLQGGRPHSRRAGGQGYNPEGRAGRHDLGGQTMSRERLYVFDTTLRDGAQTQGVDFSVEDKRQIALASDSLGIDYIEGGWPGANPTDTEFFKVRPPLTQSRFVAFGMTKKAGRSAGNDPGLAMILDADADAACLVGKSWDYQVDVALGIPRSENIDGIAQSIAAIVAKKREAMFDAEHFFDGYKANPDYALQCIGAAYEAGARWIVLCDTNGGTMPEDAYRIVSEVKARLPNAALGIHAHNDTEQAVAVTLAAVRGGARQVQGTLNGLGERCGNANLCSLLPNLLLKEPYASQFETGVSAANLARLTSVSRLLDEILNRAPGRHAPYVGPSAFAHKGGLHSSAVQKDPRTYEHVPPEFGRQCAQNSGLGSGRPLQSVVAAVRYRA